MRLSLRDWEFNFTPNHVAWLLVLVAVMLGGLIAMQTSDATGIATLQRDLTRTQSDLLRLDRELSALRIVNEALKVSTERYQAEQRQNILDFAEALKRIEVEQAKRGIRK